MHPTNTLVVDVLLILARPGPKEPPIDGVSKYVHTSKFCLFAFAPPAAFAIEYWQVEFEGVVPLLPTHGVPDV